MRIGVAQVATRLVAPMAQNIAGGMAKGVSSGELGRMKRMGDTFSRIAGTIGGKLGQIGTTGAGAGKLVAPRGEFPTLPGMGASALTARSFGPGHRNVNIGTLASNLRNNVQNVLRPDSQVLGKLATSQGAIEGVLGQAGRVAEGIGSSGHAAVDGGGITPYAGAGVRKTYDQLAGIERDVAKADLSRPDGMRQMTQLEQKMQKVNQMIELTAGISKGVHESLAGVARNVR